MKAKLIPIVAIILTGLCTQVWGQEGYALKKTTMHVKGTSTLHDWESKVGKVSGTGEIEMATGVLEGIKSLKVIADAKSIISTKGKLMDEKTWKALKADQHAKITYQLVKINSIDKQGGNYLLKSTGNLTIAGITKSVEMAVTAKMLSNGGIEFSGTKGIVLSDYNMDQPTALMGTIKVGKEVSVVFAVTFEKTDAGQ